jgi:hypothetical protein
LLSACFEGGANQNQKTPGNQDDGVGVGIGDIAVHPSGEYFLSKAGRGLVHGTIESGKTRVLPGVENPERLAFASRSEAVFITAMHGERAELQAYHPTTSSTLWQHPIESSYGWIGGTAQHYPTLKVTRNDEHLLLIHEDRIDVIDPKDGTTRRTFFFHRRIVDVDLLDPASRIMVAMEHDWKGDLASTKVAFVDVSDGRQHIIDVPNCSDEVAVAPDGRFAFLAPTTCRRDPVSVIDLESESWLRNLPGFGPVAVSPRGNVAIAFLDRDNVDRALFDDPKQIPSAGGVRYHVMFIDPVTLELDTLPIGDTLPRYALTPDGNLVLIDSASWHEDGKLRIVDVASKSIRPVSGPDVRLQSFVITSDSSRVFLIDGGLYSLSLPEALAESIALRFVPKNINITPDDEHLLLRETDSTLWVFRIADERLMHAMTVPTRLALR